MPGPVHTILSCMGGTGVALFFNLSGYLITHLLVRELRAKGRVSLGKFYVRRVLRIFPALYLYLGVLACCALLGALAISWKDLLGRPCSCGIMFPTISTQ